MERSEVKYEGGWAVETRLDMGEVGQWRLSIWGRLRSEEVG